MNALNWQLLHWKLFLHISMRNTSLMSTGLEVLEEGVGDGHRAMFATGASDRHGDIAFALALIKRHQVIEQIGDSAGRLLDLFALIEVFENRLVISRQLLQFWNEVRIGQKPDVEEQIRIQWNSEFETEAEHRDLGLSGLIFGGKAALEPSAQRVNVVIGRIDHYVRQQADGFKFFALFRDRFRHPPFTQRVRPPRLAVPALQNRIARLQKEHSHLKIGSRSEQCVNLGKCVEKFPLPDVDAQGGARNARFLHLQQVNETGYQLHRQVVDTEISNILEDIHRRRHPRSAQSSDDDQFWDHDRILRFDQAVIAVLTFVYDADTIRLGIAKDDKLFGRILDAQNSLFRRHRLDRIAARSDDAGRRAVW